MVKRHSKLLRLVNKLSASGRRALRHDRVCFNLFVVNVAFVERPLSCTFESVWNQTACIDRKGSSPLLFFLFFSHFRLHHKAFVSCRVALDKGVIHFYRFVEDTLIKYWLVSLLLDWIVIITCPSWKGKVYTVIQQFSLFNGFNLNLDFIFWYNYFWGVDDSNGLICIETYSIFIISPKTNWSCLSSFLFRYYRFLSSVKWDELTSSKGVIMVSIEQSLDRWSLQRKCILLVLFFVIILPPCIVVCLGFIKVISKSFGFVWSLHSLFK